jgi:hypothetical protein
MTLPNVALIGLVLLVSQGALRGREPSLGLIQSHIVYNSPTTPVKLSLWPNGKYVEVVNHSDKEVKRLAFGCVVETADGVVVKKTIESMEHFDLAQIDLAADSEKSGMNMFAFPTDDEIVRQCKELDTLLAVIEAKFADGSSWEIPKTKRRSLTHT